MLFRTSYAVGKSYAVEGSRIPGEYSNQLWARDRDHAQELCRIRNIGEHSPRPIDPYEASMQFGQESGPVLPSRWLERAGPRHYELVPLYTFNIGPVEHYDLSRGHARVFDPVECVKQALHAACWLGYVAQSSGVVRPDELLNDNGLIHELSHAVVFGLHKEGVNPAAIIREAKRIESITPGFQPC